MAYEHPIPGSLKRKRRRRPDKPAISAKLILDDRLKSETGLLSSDLIADLFPQHGIGKENSQVLYAAITPWTPSSISVTSGAWTILPFQLPFAGDEELPHSTIRVPTSALGLQSFVQHLQAVSPNRPIRSNAPVEIRITDVVPLPLDTVYCSLDVDALQKLESVHAKYSGGFGHTNGHAGKTNGRQAVAALPKVDDVEEQRKQLVREALRSVAVVHTNSMIPLPLIHPITHASAPPAKILACEPVSQGLLQPATRIVIVPASDKHHDVMAVMPRIAQPAIEEDEDTSNEAFFSAAEAITPVSKGTTRTQSSSSSNSDEEDSSAEESNLSDDSDDMISLTKPGLVSESSGISSALTAATPRPFGNKTNGVSTPGSMFSSMTASTMRGSQPRSRVFRAQGLLERIAEALVYPQPASDEDDEARVYVDTAALARLAAFSGDWMRLEAAEAAGNGLPDLDAFRGPSSQWRPVKVYGLPESMSRKPPRYPLNSKSNRRDSISSVVTANGAPSSTVYMSPILLANLSDPSHLRISPLSTPDKSALTRTAPQRSRIISSSTPPVAKEVNLQRISTPLSTERALQPSLFTGLRDYFEHRRRVVKSGDLIAIPIDETLGRTVFEGGAADEDVANTELLSQWNMPAESAEGTGNPTGVAWFRVGDVVAASAEEEKEGSSGDAWGGVASLDPRKTRMGQSGTEQSRVPSTTSNAWQYYLGVKTGPATASPNQGPATSKSVPPQSLPVPLISTLQRRLRELISASTSPRAVHLGLPPLAILLTSTQRNIGKATLISRACASLGLHSFPLDAYDILSEGGQGGDIKTEGFLKARAERGLTCGSLHTVLFIRHVEVLAADRMAAALKEVLQGWRVLVATSTEVDKIPDGVRGLFTHELEMSAPDEGEREGVLRDIATDAGLRLAPDVDLAGIAVKTAALVAGDLVDVVDRAVVARTARLDAIAAAASTTSTVLLKDIQLAGGAAATSLLPSDFDTAVDQARKNFADAIGAPKIPNVQWSDVGGLAHVKDAVVETIQLPLSRPELFAKGLKKRSGILFYGPPGTGKTLLAKAIATEFSLNFFSVKGPELLNMYIGESEANVRRVFQRARDARPCVVFFDELDSVAPKRGNQGDSGGVMDRIVSQLLAELDGMSDSEEGGGGVFVIGATNRPDLLDQALLRPGRFDKMLYLGVSDTHEKQGTILQALTRKFSLDPTLSLPAVANTLPFTFTGADLYALCSDAMLKAITRSARLVDAKVAAINAERAAHKQPSISVAYFFDHFAGDEDTRVAVTEADFMEAKRELVPSVSFEELRHYESVRRMFEGGAEKEKERPRARGQLKDSEMRVPSTKMAELMRRGPGVEGAGADFGEGKGGANGHAAQKRQEEDGEDDYVIRTDRLSINGATAKQSSGKGKGKTAVLSDGTGGHNGALGAGDGEGDLYD